LRCDKVIQSAKPVGIGGAKDRLLKLIVLLTKQLNNSRWAIRDNSDAYNKEPNVFMFVAFKALSDQPPGKRYNLARHPHLTCGRPSSRQIGAVLESHGRENRDDPEWIKYQCNGLERKGGIADWLSWLKSA